MNQTQPVLFVPHGAPTFALRPGAAGAALVAKAASLALPRAIVIVSAHWDTAVPTVGFAEKLETILDDGIVNEDELPDLMEVFDFLRDVGQAGRELLAESLSLGILKDMKKAAPTGMGATERARITHSKADHKAHSHCTTA